MYFIRSDNNKLLFFMVNDICFTFIPCSMYMTTTKKIILIKLLSYLLQLLWPYLFINYQGKIRKIRNLKVSCKSHIRVEEEEKVNYSSILISHESFLSVSHDLSFSSYSSVSPDNVDLTFIATFLRRFNLRCCERTQLNTLFSKTWPILKCITSFSIFFSFFHNDTIWWLL